VPTGIASPDKSIFSPGVLYLVKDYKNMELKELEKETYIHGLGLGDFFFYNLMVLFVLPPLASIRMKMCIGIGCIIFIEIGYMITIWISLFLNGNRNGPALPLPVIAFSAYIILLNVFVGDFDSDLC
jgi:hypothetical protein